MAYKLKIGPAQGLKLKGQAGFALPLIGGTGIATAKSGGMWAVSLDFSEVQSGPTVNDSTAYVLTWDSATEIFTRISVTDFKAEFEDTFDGVYQPLDADLTALAGLTSAADKLPYFTGSATAALADFTTFGRSLVADADAAAARTTLGLGTAATTAATDYATAAQGATADTAVQPGDLGTLAAKNAIDVPTDITATGTASATTYLRGDGAWATPAGSGDVVGPSSATDASVVGYDGTTGKLIKELTAAQVRTSAGAATIATLCVTFDTYRSAYDNAALTFMTTLGLVGTQFIIPEQIDAAAGVQTFTSAEIAILYAKGWEIGAYGSNAGVTVNLADMYTADRASALARLMTIKTLFRAKNIEVSALAPMQRAWWDPQLTEMARAVGFKVVRVVSSGSPGTPVFAPYPIAEPLNLFQGGDATSTSGTTTAAYLEGILDQAIAAKELMVTVTHEVNTPTDASTTDPAVLSDFLTYAKAKRDAGLLRITTLSKAMVPV